MVSCNGVSAIVLAAGSSKRMGKTNKLLATINGFPMATWAVKVATSSSAKETIVVTGCQSDLVRESLSKYSVEFVYNPDYKIGLSTSLKAGINAVSEKTAGALVLLSDMPLVSIKTINTLIEHFQDKKGRTICRPTYRGLEGNPVLWPREFFSKIKNLKGDIGARDLIKDYYKNVSLVEVKDAGIHIDFNRPGDIKTT